MIEPAAQIAVRPVRRSGPLRRFVPWSLAFADLVLIYLAFILAYWVRYSLEIGPHIQSRVSFEAYQSLGLLLLTVMLSVMFVKGAYRPRLSTDVVDEIGLIFTAATITIGVVVVTASMVQQDQYSRGVIVYLWVFMIVLVSLGRTLYRGLQGALHRRGLGTRRVLVVGATDAAKIAMQSMMSRPDLGYELAGFVYHRAATEVLDFGRFRALGTVADIPSLIDVQSIDDIIIALPAAAHEEVWPILGLCEQHGVGLKLIPDLFEMNLSRVQIDDIAGIPLLDVQERPLHHLTRSLKRTVDVLIAGILFVVSLPIVLVLMAMIKMESAGPALLRQQRVGKGGRAFTCYKLRTMFFDAADLRAALQEFNDTSGPVFKIRDDPRRTRIGRRIRRWSLDEAPQFWNVLRGEMSLVGPRPPLPTEVAEYEPQHLRRLEVKPGLTGIWQVSGRSDLPFDEMVLMDIYYVENWSLALDVRILIRTVVAVLTRRGAY